MKIVYLYIFFITKNLINTKEKLKQKFFLIKLKIMICLFHQNGKTPFWKKLKIILNVQA